MIWGAAAARWLKNQDPVVKALVETEETDVAVLRLADRDSKAFKAYDSAIKDFVAEKRRYAAHIKDALKVVSKAEHPKAYRELKVLDTTLNALQAQLENNYKSYKKDGEVADLRASGDKKAQKARERGDEDGEVAAKEKAALKTFMIQLKTLGNSATRKSLAAIQKMKSDPTLDTYNAIMNNAGRDVSQWVGNIHRLQQHPKLKRNSVVKKLPPAAPFVPALTEFGDGDKRQLDAGTAQNEIEARIKEFSQLLKSVVVAYSSILKFKE